MGRGSPTDSNGKDRKKGSEGFNRISDAFARYFSTEPEKEKVLKYEDFDAAGDTYYAGVSAWYKVLQRVFFACLAIFAAVSVALNFKYITYDNFFYLIKDFGTAVDTESTNYETLSYDASTDQSFALYRGGLAVVGRTNVSAFTATGRRTLNNNVSYSKPYAVASDKYLLVYDMGEGNLSVYNSFAKVYGETLDYPITDACFDGEGGFAVLSRSSEYESQITVYDKNFEKRVTFRKGAFAFDISLSEDGERLGALYCDTEDGIVCTKVVFYDLKKHEKTDELVYKGEFPLACTFLDGGGFAFITDGATRVLGEALEADFAYETDSYLSRRVSAVFCDGEYAALCHNDGIITDENEIFVFDKKGDLVYNSVVYSDVEQMSVCDGNIFIKNADGVLRVNMKNSESEQKSCSEGRMLVYNKKTALVCSEAKAIYIKFE